MSRECRSRRTSLRPLTRAGPQVIAPAPNWATVREQAPSMSGLAQGGG
jgi:hypothetical protein